MKRDYQAIINADGGPAAQKAYDAFLRTWRPLSTEVIKSLQEAGPHLWTFLRFPKCQWTCLRTTNPLERLNGEFRRRTKTQGAFRHEESALVLLYGLVAAGQIVLRKIHGWRRMPQVTTSAILKAA